jgi:hypothetical protein
MEMVSKIGSMGLLNEDITERLPKNVDIDEVQAIRKKILRGFDGNPSSNLVKFLVNFGLNWQYLKENERKETVDNLQKLYECVHCPFKFDEILGKNKRYRHNMMIEKMSELKLTDELSYTLMLFKKQTGQMIIPRLPEVNKVEANEELFNKASKYNAGMWAYKENKLEMNVREEENKEIVKAFDQADRNFKVITDKQDGLALLMTTEITTTRDDVRKLRDELEKNKQIFEREQRAWEELERKLGKVTFL